MTSNKQSIYETYIKRLDETIPRGFFFEAAWIEYVILEDRLVSLLRSTGGEIKPNGKPIIMMGPKLIELESRIKTNQILKGHLVVGDLINRLSLWKDERNLLMHSMVDGSLSKDEIEKKIENLAVEGAKLTREFAAAARRVKKNT